MNDEEKLELLIRVDEKITNILCLSQKQEQHLKEMNGTVKEHSIILTKVTGTLYDDERGLVFVVGGLAKEIKNINRRLYLIAGTLSGLGLIGFGTYQIFF